MSFRGETKLKTNFARWADAPVLAPYLVAPVLNVCKENIKRNEGQTIFGLWFLFFCRGYWFQTFLVMLGQLRLLVFVGRRAHKVATKQSTDFMHNTAHLTFSFVKPKS